MKEKVLTFGGSLMMVYGIIAGSDTTVLSALVILCTGLVIDELRRQEAK